MQSSLHYHLLCKEELSLIADLLSEVVLGINGQQVGGCIDLLRVVGPLSQALLVARQVALCIFLHTDDVRHRLTLQIAPCHQCHKLVLALKQMAAHSDATQIFQMQLCTAMYTSCTCGMSSHGGKLMCPIPATASAVCYACVPGHATSS